MPCAAGGGEHPLELLGRHDRDHPEAALPLGLLQVGADVVELAVIPAGAVGPLQAQHGMSCSSAKASTAWRKRLPMRLNRAGEHLVAQVLGQERDHLAADLQVGDIGVEVDAIQALQVQRYMTVQDLVDVHHPPHGPPRP